LRQAAKARLLPFTSYTFPRYRPDPAHALIASYLEKVERGDIDRLMIFAPPQTGKSELVSVRFPAWCLGRHPDWPIILASYAADLAQDKSRQCRQVVEGEAFQSLWPEVATAAESRAVDHWTIAGDRGGLKAGGVRGPLTGFGAFIGILDDPVKNAEEARSPTYRHAAKEWLETTFATRIWEGGRIVIVMTRWHEDDIAGWLLRTQKGRWTVLRLPALAETHDERERANVRLGTTDTADPLGRLPGKTLCPGRFSQETMEERRARSTPSTWNALYQGVPTPPEGSIFQREWWEDGRNRYRPDDPGYPTNVVARYLSYDTAEGKSETSGARTSCTVWELSTDYRVHLRHARAGRPSFPELPGQVEGMARHWNSDGRLRGVLIEDKSSGVQVIQTLLAAAPDWLRSLIVPIAPRVSKETRGEQAAVWCRNNCVLLPWPSEETPWLFDFEMELYDFPTGELMDQVDSATQLIIYLEHFLAEGWQARGGGN
jgi:hypothetical protein